jgi:hypothetical protein
MENAQLAPAAGAGIGKMLAEDLLARPGFIREMADVIAGAIRANTRHWDRDAKEFIVEPDHKIRLQAFFGIVAHMEGEPIKRIIHQHLGGSGTVDPLAALQESPALRDAAKKLLEKAEWRHSGHKPSKRPVKAAEALEVDFG